MPAPTLFDPVALGALRLANRIVMAPMTRSRADEGDRPTDLHVDYYAQRADAGLIVSEGIHPSIVGKGYARTPGLYDDSQVAAWRRVTDAVHAHGGVIVAQLMHVGRIAAQANRPAGVDVVAPSAIAAKAKLWTPAGMAGTMAPRALETQEIAGVVQDYALAAARAIAAGFDGVELHCTSGYLPAQFMATGANRRTDRYGGSAANRVRFVVETIEALAGRIGARRVGFRICPGNPFNDLHDDDPAETHAALLDAIGGLGLAYCHLIEMATPQAVDHRALAAAHWRGPLILNDSLDRAKAETLVGAGIADAASFGRPFIGNPDLVARFRDGHPLAGFDPTTLYAEGATGYTDYPAYRA
ncbi:alkene reductase [Rhizorhabdus wittichii]|uniref:Alkene reductase n=1 Tax=Rhizorhabdus wittichii TaxID=160791 RepID=A0A975CYM8_9SPHN|nr:alkene reductase [Rhizorhabdus wittichii]QTH19728.1 alkene reductase [Rhizorhabdus wittichii]